MQTVIATDVSAGFGIKIKKYANRRINKKTKKRA